MRPKMPSNAGLFAKLGNPWVSLRQQENDFGRLIDRENPEFDAYTAKRAPKKNPDKVTKMEARRADRADNNRRMLNRVLEMKRKMRRNKIVEVK